MDQAEFLQRVKKHKNGCWYWQGAIGKEGYGQVLIDKRYRAAHRVAHELFKGPIPEGRQIDHLCNRRQCVNPEHLECVTSQENSRRREVRGKAWGYMWRSGNVREYLDRELL